MINAIRCLVFLFGLSVFLPFSYLHAQPSKPGGPDLAIPGTPQLITPDSGAVDVELAPLLEWEEDEFAESYELQLTTDPGFPETQIDIDGLTDSEFQTDELESNTAYYWRVKAIGDTVDSDWSEAWKFTTNSTTNAEQDPDIPGELKLEQNFPNPFNPTTNISYQLPENSEVTLEVFNMLGKHVATLVSGKQQAGRHEVSFDASELSSGVYIYRIRSGDFTDTRQMMLVK